MDKVNEKFEDFVNEAKLNTKDIEYSADFANGANDINFIMSDQSLEKHSESGFRQEFGDKFPNIKFVLKEHPLEVAKEYEKVIKFLKKNQKQYPYVMVSIEDQEDATDGLELQAIHTEWPNVDKIISKYNNKTFGKNKGHVYGSSLIQKDENVDFQIPYLQSRVELFKAMYTDSLNLDNYDEVEDLGKYTFGFVWYAD